MGAPALESGRAGKAAEAVSPQSRGMVYSLNSAIGFLGWPLGLDGRSAPLWRRLVSGSFRPLSAWSCG